MARRGRRRGRAALGTKLEIVSHPAARITQHCSENLGMACYNVLVRWRRQALYRSLLSVALSRGNQDCVAGGGVVSGEQVARLAGSRHCRTH